MPASRKRNDVALRADLKRMAKMQNSAITPGMAELMIEAASVCLEHNQHPESTSLVINDKGKRVFDIRRVAVTPKMKNCHADMQRSAEFGAYGISLILIKTLYGLISIETSAKGTGFDFWLGEEDGLPFQRKARLEVSGIIAGTEPEILARVRQKINQTKRSDGLFLPAYAAVVEFSRPVAHLKRRAAKKARPSIPQAKVASKNGLKR